MQKMSFGHLSFSTALALSLVTLAYPAQAGTVFTVQLGSFESEKEARSHWEKLQNRFPDLFAPLSYASAKVQLPPDDFVYYRTQAGPIENRPEADDICRRLVVKGFECYVAETAMFMTDGDNTTEEASIPQTQSAQAAAVVAPPPPPALPQAQAAEQEMVDLLEAEEKAAPDAVSNPLPAPPKPEPIVKVDRLAPAAEKKNSSFFSFLPWVSSPSEEKREIEPTGAASLQPPLPNTPTPSDGMPFARGESAYATAASPVAAMPRPVMPSQPVALPAIPVSDSEMADLKVAEAVPVPLGEIPAASTGGTAYRPSAERGFPSQFSRSATLWAEVSYFNSQESALGYWRTLRSRDTMIPQGLRLRVVKPLRQRGGEERLSLRIGPFDNANVIRRLCSHTAPEKLRCQAMRDIGSSVSYNQQRQRLNPADAYARRTVSTQAVGKPASLSGDSQYWIQLGSFPSLEMAKSQWSLLKNTHPAQLGKRSEHIQAPGYSSATRPMYRLRVGPFASNSEANATCSALKNAGALCLVVSGR